MRAVKDIALKMCVLCMLFSAGYGTNLYAQTGMALGNGKVIYLSDNSTVTFDPSALVFGGCFSPDGKRIAYFDGRKLCITRVNGSGKYEVAGSVGSRQVTVTWIDNDWLYYSRDDSCLYRMKTDGTMRSTVYRSATGTISTAKVSRNGARAGWTTAFWSTAENTMLYNAVIGDLAKSGPAAEISFGGCQGTVSPNGLYATHNIGGHVKYEILNTADGTTYKEFPTSDATNFHRFSGISNDHVVYLCYNKGYGEVQNIKDGSKVRVNHDLRLFDYYPSELRNEPVEANILISKHLLAFSFRPEDVGAAMHASLAITNNVSATTLGTLTIGNVPPWLTVEVSGSGNNQLITNRVNWNAVDTSQTYEHEISVTSSGTSARALYTVSLGPRPDPSLATEAGLYIEYYHLPQGGYSTVVHVPDLDMMTPEWKDTSYTFTTHDSVCAAAYSCPVDIGYRYTGYISVPQSGTYTFYVKADDGANLYINGTRVVDRDGRYDMSSEASGSIALAAGKHEIRLDFYNIHHGAMGLEVRYSGTEISKQLIPNSVLWRIPDNTVRPQEPLRVFSPRWGDAYGVGDTLTVNYFADCNVMGGIEILMSLNDGIDWDLLDATGTVSCGTRNWSWKIAETFGGKSTLSETCLIRLKNYAGMEEVVSGAFAIRAAGSVVGAPARSHALTASERARVSVVRTSGALVVSWSPHMPVSGIQVTSVSGKKLWEASSVQRTGPARIPLAQLAAGVHVLSVRTAEHWISVPFVYTQSVTSGE
jgi:hypothetical protein